MEELGALRFWELSYTRSSIFYRMAAAKSFVGNGGSEADVTVGPVTLIHTRED